MGDMGFGSRFFIQTKKLSHFHYIMLIFSHNESLQFKSAVNYHTAMIFPLVFRLFQLIKKQTEPCYLHNHSEQTNETYFSISGAQ